MNDKKTKWVILTLTVFLSIGFISFLSVTPAFQASQEAVMTYVRGKYSKWCYTQGNEHHAIKTKLYFQTLEDCNRPLYE